MRVNWFRAHQQAQRWSEEFEVTTREMVWVPAFFRYKEQLWMDRVPAAPGPGHRAYALRQASMWKELRRIAHVAFTHANKELPTVFGYVPL